MEKTLTMDQLHEVIKGVVSELGYTESQEALGAKIAELTEEMSNVAKSNAKPNSDNGINQARLLKAELAVSQKMHRGELSGNKMENMVKYITEQYAAKDPAFVKEVTNRAKDLMATGNGGTLIIEEYAQGFLDQLWDTTILSELGVSFIPTKSGNLTYNKIVEGVAAGYVPETGMIDTSTVRFGSIRLSVKKLMALVPVSNDLLRMASESVDAIVRDQLIKEMAQAIDFAFLYGQGGEFEPRGLANIKDIQKVNAGAEIAPSFDLGLDMLALLRKKNMGVEDAAWVMGVDTYVKLQKEVTTSVGRAQFEDLQKLVWHGIPVVLTNKLKGDGTNEDLFLVKKDAILGIQSLDVQLDQSQTASFLTADGMVSAFHADYTITRAIALNDFGLSNDEAVVYANIKLK